MSATPDSLVQLVRSRAGGLCERCGKPASDIHHRQPRQRGGTRREHIHSAVNCVSLCRLCHDDVERHREQAYADGWLVHSWDDPRDVPWLSHLYRQLVWPDYAGGLYLYRPTRAELDSTFPRHIA